MPLLRWSSSHSFLSECRWLGEPELIPEFLIICPAGRIRSTRSDLEHARPGKTSPRGAQSWAIGGKPGLLIISNLSLASVQTKCHLVPTGGVWAKSLTRWQSKQQKHRRNSFTSKETKLLSPCRTASILGSYLLANCLIVIIYAIDNNKEKRGMKKWFNRSLRC